MSADETAADSAAPVSGEDEVEDLDRESEAEDLDRESGAEDLDRESEAEDLDRETEAEDLDRESEPEDKDSESVSRLVEQTGVDTTVLAFRWAQLELSEHAPEVRRATRAAAAAGICAVALLTAFVFGNWALASALSSPLPGWRAPLVLAAAWLAVGGIVAAVWLRSERKSVRTWLQNASAAETRAQRQAAVEEAEQTLLQDLDHLSDAVSQAAQERIAEAILPVAGGMVEVGEGMVGATDDVLEAADEITDTIEEAVPGGVVVNRAVDVALAPGRFGVRVVRTVFSLGGGTPDDESGGSGAA